MEPQQPPAGDDPRLAPLIAYLEQHRQQINIEALRKQLREAGHPPDLVDEAVRRVGGASPSKPLAWPIGLAFALLNLIVAAILFGFIASLITALFPAANNNLLWLPAPLLLCAAIPVGELLAGRRLRDGPRDRLGRALIWGGVFTLIIMGLALLLLGACLVIIFSATGGF